MSRTSFALVVSALLIGCVVSFDGYRARETANSAGNAGNPAGGSGRGGAASGGNGDAGDGPAQGGVPSEGGSGDGGETTIGGGSGPGGSAGTAGTAGTGGGAGTCPVGWDGPPLLEIPLPGGAFYCIDRTEVTNSHYAAFLAASPDSADQSTECSSWNSSFAPEMSEDFCDPLPYDPVGEPALPVRCVDWCDAKKYCEWTGKELCGALAGGPIVPTDYDDPDLDAWFRACSENGMREFPYGPDYMGNYCAGLDHNSPTPEVVASLPNCEGGYPGLWDMSGNVSEWENSCDGDEGASDQCVHRGGGILDADETPVTVRCNSVGSQDVPVAVTYPRDMRHTHLGFRCCYIP